MENRHLYRGKRIDNGKWVYGMPTRRENGEIGAIEDWDKGTYTIYDINPSTVCQCTGIKDKNGNLIFENDIMGAHIDDDFPEDVSRFKVEWNGRGWVENQPGAVDREYLDDFDTEHYAVIGNVFDDPELLEV